MKIILPIIAFVIGSLSAYGQWECRSKVGSSLKPVGNSNLMWGSEITGAFGVLDSNFIQNELVLLGIDYTKNKSSLYVEGGFKYWSTKDNRLTGQPVGLGNTVNNNAFSQFRLGLREVFYQHKSDRLGTIRFGLQTSALSDHYILNERVAGLFYTYGTSKLKFDFIAGSVSKDFSRNGSFCGVKYVYDIIPDRSYPYISDHLGETNLTGISLTYTPSHGQKTESDKNESADEFSAETDEFSADNEFSTETNETSTKKPFMMVENIGILAHTEYIELFETPSIFTGLYGTINLFADVLFRPEVIYQLSANNNGLIYSLALEKSFIVNAKHNINFRGAMHGFLGDSNSSPLNSYGNLFLGEVLRLDTRDMNILEISGRYRHIKSKFHFKAQYVTQSIETLNPYYYTSRAQTPQKGKPFSEIDFELGKIFFNHLQLNTMFCILQNIPSNYYYNSYLDENFNLIEEESIDFKTTYMLRGELRFYF